MIKGLVFEVASVNALHRAIPISTQKDVNESLKRLDVSMPYIGLSPFLRWLDDITFVWIRGVNALHRAIPISTLGIVAEGFATNSVNALHRAIPISTELLYTS